MGGVLHEVQAGGAQVRHRTTPRGAAHDQAGAVHGGGGGAEAGGEHLGGKGGEITCLRNIL